MEPRLLDDGFCVPGAHLGPGLVGRKEGHIEGAHLEYLQPVQLQCWP
jgi:hypothetical protein